MFYCKQFKERYDWLLISNYFIIIDINNLRINDHFEYYVLTNLSISNKSFLFLMCTNSSTGSKNWKRRFPYDLFKTPFVNFISICKISIEDLHDKEEIKI